MEAEKEKVCNQGKKAERTLLSSEQLECISDTVDLNDTQGGATASFKSRKSTTNEDEKLEANKEEVQRDDTLLVYARNKDKQTEGNSKLSKTMDILPATSTKSIESYEATTSQENISLFSNGNESSTSGLEQNKIKRRVSKGQPNGDSGISMEKSGNSSDEDSSKRQKLTENSDNLKTTNKDTPESGSATFHKLKSKIKKRSYRNKTTLPSGSRDNFIEVTDDVGQAVASEGTSAHGNEESTERLGKYDKSDDIDHSGEGEDDSNERTTASEDELEEEVEDEYDNVLEDEDKEEDQEEEGEVVQAEAEWGETDEEAEEEGEWGATDEEAGEEEEEEDPEDRVPSCLQKKKPKHNWCIVPEVLRREIGKNPLFQRRFYGSLHAVERLELMYKLKEHEGCVNAISFNQKGNLLASGSDDLKVVIWDWAIEKQHMIFNSGHRSNLVQAKWLPLDVEYLMVTSALDSEVRLLDLKHGTSRVLATHSGPTHKVSVHPNSPHVIISVGEDARVLSIDVRDSKPTQLLIVKDGVYDVPLYTIHSNPLNSNEFCVGGRARSVKIYDRRKPCTQLNVLYPDLLLDDKHAYVTSAVYNYNGTEILASYNDEDIYLFDASVQTRGDFIHRYQGHRNKTTVKGVNFFGPKSEFICSGSDCGNIFIWDKNTEAIVQWMPGDEEGVVNCLEPHPHIPILATSGLDCDVKIWVPSCEQPPTMKNLEYCVRTNCTPRKYDGTFSSEAIREGMFRIVLESMFPRIRGRNHNTDGDSDDSNQDDDDSDDSSNYDGSDRDYTRPPYENFRRLQCPPS